VLERENLLRALKRVRTNKGSGGIDGMAVEELTPYLKEHWPNIRKTLLEGTYKPHPVRRSERAGKRVMASVSRFLTRKLKLKVNEAKSAVGRPWERKFLGFTFTRQLKRRISPEAVEKFKGKVRLLTNRHLGRSMRTVAADLRQYMTGWETYFGYAEVRTTPRELNAWLRRRLRCYLWKQWGRAGYRKLKKLGVSRDLAWNTAKSAHGAWRLSKSPGLAF